jgi:hypothetical protein
MANTFHVASTDMPIHAGIVMGRSGVTGGTGECGECRFSAAQCRSGSSGT